MHNLVQMDVERGLLGGKKKIANRRENINSRFLVQNGNVLIPYALIIVNIGIRVTTLAELHF